MRTKHLIKLLERLREELGYRARNDYVQLFGRSTIHKLDKLIKVLGNLSLRLSEQTLFKAINDELLNILEDAGTYLPEEVHDNAASLCEIKDVISEINVVANGGVFGDAEIACRTDAIKTWLSRSIESVQAYTSNRLCK